MQLFQDTSLVLGFAVLQDPLNDSASVRMCSKYMRLTSKSFDDELDVLCWDSLDGLLHDVIPVLIFDTFKNIGLKFCDEFGLLIRENMFKSLYELALEERGENE